MSSTHLLGCLCCLSCLIFASCTSETKDITIITSPADATVYINGEEQVDKSPLIAAVPQRDDVNIVAMRAGYKTKSKTLIPEIDTFYAILWTKYDERARYISEDTVQLTLPELPSSASYKPSSMSEYKPSTPSSSAKSKKSPSSTFEAPTLRPIPNELQ